MIKLIDILNELNINAPRATLAQLKSWQVEIKASEDKTTKIQLALKCAEGVLFIWREKYPNDMRPQNAINAIKEYLKNPSEENKQKCANAANAANAAADAADAANAAANAANAATAAAYAAAYAADAANDAIQALKYYQNEKQLV